MVVVLDFPIQLHQQHATVVLENSTQQLHVADAV